jgi:hypothetical protein
MYNWYKAAHTCYVYLEDVSAEGCESQFQKARWWTRGWTLQELIAPTSVEFYSSEWELLGTKRSLESTVEEITGIDVDVLRGHDPIIRNAAQRMAWAANRITTRSEDTAYCLLGLFGVNMPLLYGEGLKAFQRLQEEIMKKGEDYTLFCWTRDAHSTPSAYMESTGLLAPNPNVFSLEKSDPDLKIKDYGKVKQVSPTRLPYDYGTKLKDEELLLAQPPQLTSRGLRITLLVHFLKDDGRILAFLNCVYLDTKELVCISLRRADGDQSESQMFRSYVRIPSKSLQFLPTPTNSTFECVTMYIKDRLIPKHMLQTRDLAHHVSFQGVAFICFNGRPISYHLAFRRTPGAAAIFDISNRIDSFYLAFGIGSYCRPWCKFGTKAVVKEMSLTEWAHHVSQPGYRADFISKTLDSGTKLTISARRCPDGWLARQSSKISDSSWVTETYEYVYCLNVTAEETSESIFQVVQQFLGSDWTAPRSMAEHRIVF